LSDLQKFDKIGQHFKRFLNDGTIIVTIFSVSYMCELLQNEKL